MIYNKIVLLICILLFLQPLICNIILAFLQQSNFVPMYSLLQIYSIDLQHKHVHLKYSDWMSLFIHNHFQSNHLHQLTSAITPYSQFLSKILNGLYNGLPLISLQWMRGELWLYSSAGRSIRLTTVQSTQRGSLWWWNFPDDA